MRILVAGRTGQIGWELERALVGFGEVIAADRRLMDLSNVDSIRSAICEVRPDVIVNAAAYTDVDGAETNPDLAMAINAIAPRIIAEEAGRLDAAVVHYSTDYIFDGSKNSPYDEDDSPNPLNAYGRTKLAGEEAIRKACIPHLIFRVSWIYGARRQNFLVKLLRLAEEQSEVRVVDDQIGTPCWCRMVAQVTTSALVRCCQEEDHSVCNLSRLSGTYNLTAGGQTTRYGFAVAILERLRELSAARFKDSALSPWARARLVPVSTRDVPRAALRPRNSTLCGRKLADAFGIDIPDWREGLCGCLSDFLEYGTRPSDMRHS